VGQTAVATAVVGQHALDADAVALVEGDGATKEAGRCCRLLVVEDLGVGEAAVVVDGDMDVLVADGVADAAGSVGVAAVVVLPAIADPPPGAAVDPAEFLDIDVEELAGA
jgi:hypothetical protein